MSWKVNAPLIFARSIARLRAEVEHAASLNRGLAQVPPSTGSNPFPDTAYWNTSSPGNYADGGIGGMGIFRRDTGWTTFSGAIAFNALDPSTAIPAPTLSPLAMLLLAGGVVLIASMGLR